MGLCRPFLVPEEEHSRKTIKDRDGAHFDNQYFHVTTIEGGSIFTKLRGALQRDKYRVQAKGPNNVEYIVATSDSFEEIVRDWQKLQDALLPLLKEDPEKIHQLPKLVDDLMKSKLSGLVTGAYRRPSTTENLKKQRADFDEKLQTLKTGHASKTENQLEKFQIYRTLGTGSFGRVLLCKEKATGKYVALKMIKKDIVIRLKQVEHTANEKNILACIDCPFVINLIDYFQDKKNLYFALEYINGGEMFTHIHRNRYFSYDVGKFYAAQVVLGFEYLHNLDIVYRDLKPENLLIDFKGNVRITDLGFAKRVPDRTWTLCGTPEYLAPEIILSKGYSHAVDWWALGVLIYEMRSGHAPFYDPSQMEMYKKIVEGRLAFPAHMKPDERSIISGFLTGDLTRRLGNMKNGVKDIKSHAYFKGVDWEAMYELKVPSPYVPRTNGEGDDSNFDRYDEEPIKWAGDDVKDPYEEIFKDF